MPPFIIEESVTWIRSLAKSFSLLSDSCHHELDLYRDLRPFDASAPMEFFFYNKTLIQEKERNPTNQMPLSPLLPTSSYLNRSRISKSFILVRKNKGELIHKLVLYLSRAFQSKDFYVASSGYIDLLGSGLVLLCCGKTIEYIEHFDRLPHTYHGTFRIGQMSESYDLKTHIHSSHPWRHISGVPFCFYSYSFLVVDDEIAAVAKSLVGNILLPPDPFIVTHSASENKLYNLRRVFDQSEKPCTVHALDLHRSSPDSPELQFNLVTDAYLSPASLANEFGRRLGCRAVLTSLHKSSIGDYTEDMAWDEYSIIQAFVGAKTGIVHYPDENTKERVSTKTMWYLKRVTGQNWFAILREKRKRQKLKPFEQRYLKAVRRDLEARGLISDEDIMKRKLKKKAIKLVANMNVDEIENVYEQMLEE
eukprot:g2265.t1